MVYDKAAKEAFVSNLTGGTVWEINTVTLVAPAAVLLWSVLQSRQSFFTPYTLAAAVTDVLLNCIAILLATTLYSDSPWLLNALLISHAVFVSFASAPPNTHSHARVPSSSRAEANTAAKDPLPLKPFVTAWRGAMLVITCVAILAVDFQIFPRRFAKVENWGTSLMDLGVGSFVFSAGVVSARAILKQQASRSSTPLGRRLYTSFRHSLPLLVLGLIRLYSVKGLDYAEHVTEYGVHWNFFFTLGFLPPFVALFESAFSILPSYAALSLILGLAYEIALDFTELTALIIAAPRKNLFLQNREGIFSFLGYLAIFLAGRSTGMYILPRTLSPSSTATNAASSSSSSSRPARRPSAVRLTKDSLHELIAELRNHRFNPFRLRLSNLPHMQTLLSHPLPRLLLWTAAWTTLYALSTAYSGLNLRPSRRLANLPYYLWVAAFNSGQLALFCAIETLVFPQLYGDNGAKLSAEQERRRARDATSRVLWAFNRNGLAVFLLANLLTGLVNLALPTLQMAELPAAAVLVAYVAVLSGVALALDAWDVSIKL
ncbi:GPI-anchored wall transfer protein 1 [Phyllosticta capitalensis]|uniref:GPI-anchored wall transfer protein n=1 Tax=Phyllosticta capitalensis TaxID=121624 RepID=A0ABR1YH29_9PEZI